MSELLVQFDRILKSRGRAALATLVSAKGTTPKKAGATMWVGAAGDILGSVTIGGCVDARVIEQADDVLRSGTPRLLQMTLGDEEAWDLGLTCGGAIEVLMQRVDATDAHDPSIVAYRAALDAYQAGNASVVVAALGETPQRLAVFADGRSAGTLGDPSLDVMATLAAVDRLRDRVGSGIDRLVSGGRDVRLYFELLAPPETVVIYGASHVAMSLTVLARELGMRAVVVDGRERYATRDRFPHADEIHVGMPSEIAERLPATKHTHVVLLAHDYKYDLPVLRHVLRSDAAYVGMLGSRKRGAAIRALLADEGFSEAELARLRTPVGLDIGARSASEIALAIAAEIVAAREGRTAVAMRVPPSFESARPLREVVE